MAAYHETLNALSKSYAPWCHSGRQQAMCALAVCMNHPLNIGANGAQYPQIEKPELNRFDEMCTFLEQAEP